MATHSRPYEAVVVGAGPAGITCVGNLLERKLAPILWVDDRFDGGRINRMYREVPSNTKVRLFMEFGTAVSPFREAVSGQAITQTENSRGGITGSGEKEDRLKFLRELDQEQGCDLAKAADMCLVLTDGLQKTAGVETQQARVAEATLQEASSFAPWTVRLDNNTPTVQTKRLVFCTGSSPNNDPLPVDVPGIHALDLDTALSPIRLSAAVNNDGLSSIAVIGASHSAVIVLMNLYHLATTTRPDLRVKWLTRHPLRYAQQMDGWILRDNTGLKGEAATWAKNNLEADVFEKSDVSKYMSRIEYPAGEEETVFKQHLLGCERYIKAIGYSRNRLPVIKTTTGEAVTPYFDHERGSFNYKRNGSDDSIKLPGLYGAGIAFPERVTDPHGNVELAVGFFKFMKFVKRVSPEWN